MSQLGYSTGRDITLAAIMSDGTPLRFGKIITWNAKEEVTDQKIKAIDGNVDHLIYLDGWSGQFKMERTGSDLDVYFAARESAYYAGQDLPSLTLQQTIKEPDGSVSQYRFTRVILKMDDAGEWAGDKTVSQTVSFMASRRIQQS